MEVANVRLVVQATAVLDNVDVNDDLSSSMASSSVAHEQLQSLMASASSATFAHNFLDEDEMGGGGGGDVDLSAAAAAARYFFLNINALFLLSYILNNILSI